MRANLICMLKDTFTNEQYSAALKASYLLSDQTLSLGDTQFTIDIKNFFEQTTIEMKIMAMELAAQNNADDDTRKQLEEVVSGFKKANKDFRKIKHKTTQIIFQYRKMEHSFIKLYEDFAQHLLQNANEVGLPVLAEIEEEGVFDIYSISTQDPETYSKICESEILLSDAILGNLPGNVVGGEIVLVGNNYINNDLLQGARLVDAHEDGATNSKCGFLETICKFPSMSALTGKELRNLRNTFIKPGSALRASIDTWANFYKEDITTNEKERIDHFIQVVKPLGEALEKRLRENETLQFVAQSSKTEFNEYNVLLGETSIEHLWDFYKYIDIVPESTLEKLTAYKEANPAYLEKRVPIMCVISYRDVNLNLVDTFELEEKALEDQKVGAFKKSISLD